MIRRPPRSTQSRSSAASDVYKRQAIESVIAGEVHAGASRGFLVGPPCRDDLGAGIEAEALRTVSVVVAEERVLPSPEGEVPHGHRDRHVDACLLYTSPSPRD